jgi:hypothetical protein
MKTLAATEDWNKRNILEHTVAIYVWKHMQHPDQNACNISLETDETVWTNACNMPLKHLQHMQHPLIYFCNIHMKLLQHTSETSETIKTYICNIGGERPGLIDFGRRGGTTQHQRCARALPPPALRWGIGGGKRHGHRGRRATTTQIFFEAGIFY